MHVLIATPSAGGIAPMAYTQSIVSAGIAIHEAGGSYRYCNIDAANVVTARNLLAHIFLQDPACTHILFIDSDMAIASQVVARMIAARALMVGAVYTTRAIDLPAYARAVAAGRSEDEARALASEFNVKIAPGQLHVREFLCEVEALGFGCVLIARALLERMIAAGVVGDHVSSKLEGYATGGRVRDFFGEIRLENGADLSEDYSFCARVRQLGDTPILGYVGAGVGHVGSFVFQASYFDRLKTEKT